MGRKKEKDGAKLFDQYYRAIYSDRWENLKQSMLRESQPVLLSEELSEPYYLDTASITAATALPVKEGDNVLDMCAAPGGKTLCIALRLKGTGSLVSNDRSPARRQRLKRVIETCLPEEYRGNITVSGHDSTKWGLYEKDRYDCVLLDAPCSSERHVLQDESELAKWSANRPRILALTQFAMLAAALDAVKVGGYILYSTCSINPEEDGRVIDKLFRKRNDRFEIIKLESDTDPSYEGYGNIILPDSSNGSGPLYYCLIRRIK